MASAVDERRPLLWRSTAEEAAPSCVSSVWRTRLACAAVLVTETLERLAFYGVVGNLVLFLNMQPFLWESYNASVSLFMFMGISYLTSLLGGWIADSLLGRFKTILLFFAVYVAGYSFFPALYPYPGVDMYDAQVNISAPSWCAGPGTCLKKNSKDSTIVAPGEECCAWAVFLALVLIGVSVSAMKTNLPPFGADQVRHLGPHTTRTFFNWFYWCINCGSLISLGAIAFIQQEVSFFWGYLVPAICLFIAALVFALGGPNYKMSKPQGSVLGNIFKVIIEAFRLKCRKRSRYQVVENTQIDGVSAAGSDNHDNHGFLDNAKVRHGGSFHDSLVNDVKSLLKVGCVFLTLIPYHIVYLQMETTFVIQGLHMRLDFAANESSAECPDVPVFKIPAAWLSLFDVVIVILLIPLMDRVVYPFCDKKGRPISLRVRIGLGMVFAILAVSTAGTLEMYRREVAHRNETVHQKIGGTIYYAADMTVLLQIPQYTLIGISEVFTYVAGLEFAYSQGPRSLQGIIMGLFYTVVGLGSMIGSGLIYLFTGIWFHNKDHGNINCEKCHLDYYFFVLAGIQVFGLVTFVLVVVYIGIGGNVPRTPRPSLVPRAGRNNIHVQSNGEPAEIT